MAALQHRRIDRQETSAGYRLRRSASGGLSLSSEAAIEYRLADIPSASLIARIEALARLPGVLRLAVMPDVHQGEVFPNGIVAAVDGLFYPELVGSDIGCGFSAIKCLGSADELRPRLDASLLAAMTKVVPTLMLRDPAGELPDGCPERGLSCKPMVRRAGREGRLQLGSLGRGNHFIELDKDESDSLWIVVHSGSRAMGQAITAHHLSVNGEREKCGFRGIEAESPAGRECMADYEWAEAYARENRTIIINRVADLLENRLGIDVETDSWIDCPHNIARREQVGGKNLIVHRKSANSAAEGEAGIIAGSMADGLRIVSGLGDEACLSSSSHGAGRVMSRSDAYSLVAIRDFVGRMRGVVFNESRAFALRDEAPQS